MAIRSRQPDGVRRSAPLEDGGLDSLKQIRDAPTYGTKHTGYLLHYQPLSPSAFKEFCELEQGQADRYLDTEMKKAQVTYRLSNHSALDKQNGVHEQDESL
jgi:hypothetical protein